MLRNILLKTLAAILFIGFVAYVIWNKYKESQAPKDASKGKITSSENELDVVEEAWESALFKSDDLLRSLK